MSFLHANSCESIKTELDLFTVPTTQTSIESSQFVTYNPVSSLTQEGPVEFVIAAQSEEYIALSHTYLLVRLQILPTGPTDPTALAADGNKFSPVNNLLSSLFSQVDVSFNQKTVSSSGSTYPYRAYIESLLNYGVDAASTHRGSSLWFLDSPGKFESTHAGQGNEGLDKRLEYVKDEKTVQLTGYLHGDVFTQERLLLNGIELAIRLIRSKDAFVLMQPAGAVQRKVVIKDISLVIRRVKVAPNILISHAKMLSTASAKYPIKRVEVKSFILHSGINGTTLDNIVLGQLPRRLIIGMVDNRAFTGNKSYYPFNFQHFSLCYLALYVDGQQYPPLKPDYTNGNYVNEYNTLFSGTGIFWDNAGHQIKLEDYPKGNTLYCWDLSPDLSSSCHSHWCLVKQGNIRLELQFSQALANTVNCIVYAEYDNILTVDANRQVSLDYTS